MVALEGGIPGGVQEQPAGGPAYLTAEEVQVEDVCTHEYVVATANMVVAIMVCRFCLRREKVIFS